MAPRERVLVPDLGDFKAVDVVDVLVQPGELVLADFDGIVVVPRAVEAETMRLAAEKVDKETSSRADLIAGKSLREVYNTYHVL